MSPANDRLDAQATLARLGIGVPATDLPFLQKTLLRQQEVLAQLSSAVPADTEPAHVFRLRSDAVPLASKVHDSCR